MEPLAHSTSGIASCGYSQNVRFSQIIDIRRVNAEGELLPKLFDKREAIRIHWPYSGEWRGANGG